MHIVLKARYKPNYVCTFNPLSTASFNTRTIMLSELKKQSKVPYQPVGLGAFVKRHINSVLRGENGIGFM